MIHHKNFVSFLSCLLGLTHIDISFLICLPLQTLQVNLFGADSITPPQIMAGICSTFHGQKGH